MCAEAREKVQQQQQHKKKGNKKVFSCHKSFTGKKSKKKIKKRVPTVTEKKSEICSDLKEKKEFFFLKTKTGKNAFGIEFECLKHKVKVEDFEKTAIC